MKSTQGIYVIIPAFNEENAVGKVVRSIPVDLVEEIIVIDNNSSDRTQQKAIEAGATLLEEKNQGYGAACLKGIEYLKGKKNPRIVIFIDADYSDYPEEMGGIIQPIESGMAELVIGSRSLGHRESGSMTFPQIFGNWLATTLIKLFWGYNYSDLGPFRAISWSALNQINMEDKTYGWTVEMQLKVAKYKLPFEEVPVNYRRRIGKSKISGTVKGTFMAGYKILYTIFKYL